MHLQLADPADSLSSLSLAVRDRETEEDTYDNGTILTEMLLASEIKGLWKIPVIISNPMTASTARLSTGS